MSQLGCSKEPGASATEVVIEDGDDEEEGLWEYQTEEALEGKWSEVHRAVGSKEKAEYSFSHPP